MMTCKTITPSCQISDSRIQRFDVAHSFLYGFSVGAIYCDAFLSLFRSLINLSRHTEDAKNPLWGLVFSSVLGLVISIATFRGYASEAKKLREDAKRDDEATQKKSKLKYFITAIAAINKGFIGGASATNIAMELGANKNVAWAAAFPIPFLATLINQYILTIQDVHVHPHHRSSSTGQARLTWALMLSYAVPNTALYAVQGWGVQSSFPDTWQNDSNKWWGLLIGLCNFCMLINTCSSFLPRVQNERQKFGIFRCGEATTTYQAIAEDETTHLTTVSHYAPLDDGEPKATDSKKCGDRLTLGFAYVAALGKGIGLIAPALSLVEKESDGVRWSVFAVGLVITLFSLPANLSPLRLEKSTASRNTTTP